MSLPRKPCAERYASKDRTLGKCKDSARSSAKQWAKENPERAEFLHFRARLNRYYGITPDDWQQMFQEQDGRCAICSRQLGRNKATHVDHDHVSNKVRALLCGKCNKGLGQFEDSAEILRKAADYLVLHKKVG